MSPHMFRSGCLLLHDIVYWALIVIVNIRLHHDVACFHSYMCTYIQLSCFCLMQVLSMRPWSFFAIIFGCMWLLAFFFPSFFFLFVCVCSCQALITIMMMQASIWYENMGTGQDREKKNKTNFHALTSTAITYTTTCSYSWKFIFCSFVLLCLVQLLRFDHH